ncbi:MAG TPA: LamG domain-containing protein [Candidatus Acidoferrum sp.]|nr:LamG domain-containing protein [Candidatus Acidoferrum sp.]
MEDKSIFDEAGLDPKEWELVDSPPIIPAADLETALQYPAHRLPVGMLSIRAQAERPQAGIPVRALWPVQAPGKANSNSAIVSGTAKIARQAQQGVAVANTPVVGVDGSGNTTLAPISKLPTPPKIRMPVTQDNMPDGSNFGRVVNTALTSNQIDPSKSGVLMKGSIPTTLSGNFSYTATTSSITISWTNLVLYRADGTTTSISNGSQTITGLRAGTTYYLYPCYDESLAAIKFIANADLSQPSPNLVGVTFQETATPLGYVSTTTNLTRPTSATVEFWFRTTLTTQGIQLATFASVQTGSGGTKDFSCSYAATGKVSFTPGTSTITGGANLNDGNWHHFVGTYNGTTAFLYADGVQVATGAVTAATSFTGWWRILQDDVTGFASNPTVSSVAIYNSVLSATQVSNHYQTMKLNGPSGYNTLVSNDGASFFWKLDETSGTTAADSIGTNTGTYQATVTLNQSQAIFQGSGSPAIAWPAPFIQGQQAQSLQNRIALSAGSTVAATPASGTAGGVAGGATGPGGGGAKTLQ